MQVQALLNNRIAKLSIANIGLVVVWYFLWAEFQNPFSTDEVPEVDVIFRMLLLVLLGLSIGLWALLARAFWQRFRIERCAEIEPSKENKL